MKLLLRLTPLKEWDIAEVVKLKWWPKSVWFLCALLVLAGCGSSEQTSVPVPVTPEPTTSTPENITPPATPVDSRIPRLYTIGSQINLVDGTTFLGAQDIAFPEFLPLPIVQSKIGMELPKSLSREIEGKMLIGFEHHDGLWHLTLPSFPGAGYRDHQAFDMIFADKIIVVRVIGRFSSEGFSGDIHYRLRKSGENQCKAIRVICDPRVAPSDCPKPPDTVAPCREYTDPTAVANKDIVKKLGSFNRVDYSTWATIMEDE